MSSTQIDVQYLQEFDMIISATNFSSFWSKRNVEKVGWKDQETAWFAIPFSSQYLQGRAAELGKSWDISMGGTIVLYLLFRPKTDMRNVPFSSNSQEISNKT